jgi:outer membrane lipoprotein-sorting protein
MNNRSQLSQPFIALASLVVAAGAATAQPAPPAKAPPTKPTSQPAAGPVATPRSTTPTAPEILARTAAVYSACSTYRDHGQVRITLTSGNTPPTTETKTFSTAFSRPDAFRFDFQDKAEATPGHANQSVIWTDAGKAKAWWTFKPKVEEFATLGPAMAAADGLLGSTATIIPHLLIPKGFQSRSLTDLTDLQGPTTERIEGVDCYKLQGNLGAQPISVWIDRQTSLVRKLAMTRTMPNTTAETIATFTPELNAAVEPRQLTYTPAATAPTK